MKITSSLAAVLAVASLFLPRVGQARTVEPGTIWLSAGLGPAIKLGSALGASSANLAFSVQGEYALSKELGVHLEVDVGFPGTIPMRFRLGARYRFTQLELPVSPYALLDFSVGRLFDVLNKDHTYVGARFGGGAEYFLTAEWAAGALVAFDLGSTLGERPTFYGTTDIIFYASYAF